MSATIRSDGERVRYIGRTVQLEQVTARDVQDPEKLARILNSIQAEVARNAEDLPGEWVEFEDVSFVATTDVRLTHNLGGRVRYSVVGVHDAPSFALALHDVDGSDDDTLVLQALETLTASVRIWRAD